MDADLHIFLINLGGLLFPVWMWSSLLLSAVVIKTIGTLVKDIRRRERDSTRFSKYGALLATIPGVLAPLPFWVFNSPFWKTTSYTHVSRAMVLALAGVFAAMIVFCRQWESWPKLRFMVVCGLVTVCAGAASLFFALGA